MKMKFPLLVLLIAVCFFPASQSMAKEVNISLKKFDQLMKPSADDIFVIKAYVSETKLDQCKPCPPKTLCEYCLPPYLSLIPNAKALEIEDNVVIPLHKSPPEIKQLDREQTYIIKLKPYYNPERPDALPEFDLIDAQLQTPEAKNVKTK